MSVLVCLGCIAKHTTWVTENHRHFFIILEKSGEGSPFGLLIDSHLFDMSLCDLFSVHVVSGGVGHRRKREKGKEREGEREGESSLVSLHKSSHTQDII